jgi:hypothetical protein
LFDFAQSNQVIYKGFLRYAHFVLISFHSICRICMWANNNTKSSTLIVFLVIQILINIIIQDRNNSSINFCQRPTTNAELHPSPLLAPEYTKPIIAGITRSKNRSLFLVNKGINLTISRNDPDQPYVIINGIQFHHFTLHL